MTIEPASTFIDANGLRLHTLTWHSESSDGEPILLNHATGFMSRLWQPVAERLAAAGYTVHAYDARGHGDSDKPDVIWENYDWHRFADDLRAWLEAMALRSIPFVGHSMGAGVGLFVAGHNPDYFSRIVAIEPIAMPGGFVPDNDRREQMAASARRRRMTFSSTDEIVAQYKTRGAFAHWPEDMLRLYAAHGTFHREDGHLQLKCSGDVEGEVFASSGTLNIWDVLPDIRTPTLVIRGEHTEPFVGMIAGQVADRLPNARLLTLPNLGHLAPMENANAVADEILSFL